MEQLDFKDLVGDMNKAKLRRLLKENIKEDSNKKFEGNENLKEDKNEVMGDIEGSLDSIKTSNINSINNLEKLQNTLLEKYEEMIKGVYEEICADKIDSQKKQELHTLSDTLKELKENLILMHKIKDNIEEIYETIIIS